MALNDGLQFSFEMNEASGNRIDSVSGLELAPTGQVSLIGGYFGNAVDIADGSRLVGTVYNSAYRGAGSFTVACWVNLDVINLGSSYPIIRWNGGGTARDYNLAVSTAGAARFEVTTTTASVNAVTSTGTISTGTWFLLVGWYDATVGANGTAYIQVNNGPVFSVELTGPRENVDTSTVLSIGQGNYGFTPFGRTDGKIDKVRKWSRVLTAIERVELLSSDLGFKRRASSTFAKRYTYNPPKAKVFEGVRVRDHDYASLRQGLVGAWCPSLPNGGSGNTLPDVSGRGNHGTLTNMDASDWVSGQYGRALDFDGVNDYVSCSGISLPQDQSYTACCFVRMPNVTDVERRAFFSTAGSPATFTVSLEWGNDGIIGRNNKFQAFTETTVGPQDWFVTSTTSAVANTWYHVLSRVDTANDTISIFVNGILEATTSFAGLLTKAGVGFNIGTYRLADGRFMEGVMDDVRLYSRALTESEIKLLASKRGIGLQPSPTRLIAKEKKTGLRRKILTGQT